jgi:hypothetical protein
LLDQLGNWEGVYSEDLDLGPVVTYERREHNDANEVTNVVYPTTNTDPTHNDAGNMTTIPQPKNLAAGYSAKYCRRLGTSTFLKRANGR